MIDAIDHLLVACQSNLYPFCFFCRFVFISMDVLDQLLVACHSHSLNLFVESFLKMVQKLLEFDGPDLQVLATQSVSISQIRPRKIILVLLVQYW